MIWLSEDDVEALLDPGTLVEAVQDGFRELTGNGIGEPPASRIDALGEGSSYITVFPCYRRATGLASAKVLVGRRDNPGRGLPEIDAVVVVADAAAGDVVAVISARALTALRTAATTAVAVRRLCGGPGSRVAGIIGTGGQGLAHARMLAAAGIADGFLVASPSGGAARAADFAASVRRATGLAARAGSVAETVRGSDVVVTATLAPAPLVGEELGRDAILACIGPFYPGETEVDPRLLRDAAMVVSDHPARLRRQWEGVAGVIPDTVVALSDLLDGHLPVPVSGRRIFLSDGRAFEDNIAATLVIEAATRTGRGLTLHRSARERGRQ